MKKLCVFLLTLLWIACNRDESDCFTCTFQSYVDNGGGYQLVNIESFDTCGLELNDADDIEEDGTYTSGKYKYVTTCQNQ